MSDTLIRSCAANSIGSAVTAIPEGAEIERVTAEPDGSGGIIGTVEYEFGGTSWRLEATIAGWSSARILTHLPI